MKTKLAAVLLILLAGSCKTKEKTVQRDIIRDTIYSSTELVRQPQILEKVYVPNICDTLNNTVKEFERVVVIGQDTARLSLIENTLMFEIKKLERIIEKQDSINKISYNNQVLEKEVIKYRTPIWVWYLVAGSVIAFLFSIRVWRYF